MADFPVPTQDTTTGDDKQGMKRTSFIFIRMPSYVSSSISPGTASNHMRTALRMYTHLGRLCSLNCCQKPVFHNVAVSLSVSESP